MGKKRPSTLSTRKRRVVLYLDPHVHDSLIVLADLTQSAPAGKHSVEQMIQQAAFCMSQVYSRPGSWEAEAGRKLMLSSGLIPT